MQANQLVRQGLSHLVLVLYYQVELTFLVYHRETTTPSIINLAVTADTYYPTDQS